MAGNRGPNRDSLSPQRELREGIHMEAYCMKCKGKREMTHPEPITMHSGKPAPQGKCPECNTKMFKIGAAS